MRTKNTKNKAILKMKSEKLAYLLFNGVKKGEAYKAVKVDRHRAVEKYLDNPYFKAEMNRLRLEDREYKKKIMRKIITSIAEKIDAQTRRGVIEEKVIKREKKGKVVTIITRKELTVRDLLDLSKLMGVYRPDYKFNIVKKESNVEIGDALIEQAERLKEEYENEKSKNCR